MINVTELTEWARYSDCLQGALHDLNAAKILRLKYESDYEGFVDIDVLLASGEVFSYYYSYGSCSGCDEWESEGLSDEQIIERMKKEATVFDNMVQYEAWRAKCD